MSVLTVVVVLGGVQLCYERASQEALNWGELPHSYVVVYNCESRLLINELPPINPYRIKHENPETLVSY